MEVSGIVLTNRRTATLLVLALSLLVVFVATQRIKRMEINYSTDS